MSNHRWLSNEYDSYLLFVTKKIKLLFFLIRKFRDGHEYVDGTINLASLGQMARSFAKQYILNHSFPPVADILCNVWFYCD